MNEIKAGRDFLRTWGTKISEQNREFLCCPICFTCSIKDKIWRKKTQLQVLQRPGDVQHPWPAWTYLCGHKWNRANLCTESLHQQCVTSLYQCQWQINYTIECTDIIMTHRQCDMSHDVASLAHMEDKTKQKFAQIMCDSLAPTQQQPTKTIHEDWDWGETTTCRASLIAPKQVHKSTTMAVACHTPQHLWTKPKIERFASAVNKYEDDNSTVELSHGFLVFLDMLCSLDRRFLLARHAVEALCLHTILLLTGHD